jgi:hypothetical protein
MFQIGDGALNFLQAAFLLSWDGQNSFDPPTKSMPFLLGLRADSLVQQ